MANFSGTLKRFTAGRPLVFQRLTAESLLMHGMILAAGVWLVTFVLLPLVEILRRSLAVVGADGRTTYGLGNFVDYFERPGLARSFQNSMEIATWSSLITVVLAFAFAYALTRTAMPGKLVFRSLAMLPIFAPSLVHGISFTYLFGNKGILTRGMLALPGYNLIEKTHTNRVLELPFTLDIGLYHGPTGIILAEVFYLFPHALIILMISLSIADARLYEAATALGTTRLRAFYTITLPSIKYGLISTVFVCFTLVITDFGIPKVINANYDVMATQIYQQVFGLQRFDRASTVAILLLLPVVIGFVIDRFAQRRQMALIRSGSVPLQTKRHWVIDSLAFAFCTLVVLAILIVIATAGYASVVKTWPYNHEMGWQHYDFKLYAGGYGGSSLQPYWNSVRMASLTAVFGTVIVFLTAYFIEKGKGLQRVRALLYFLSTLPVALPGLVLGLAYIFFFNNPGNPLNRLYGTMSVLVLSTIVHFFTVSFFTASAALKQIDREFEAVSESLSVPFVVTFWRVTVPISLPAILEIAVYYFVNAMTTVSAVIFLYSANLKLASVAAVSMDDAGDKAPAAAMCMLIFFTGIAVRLIYEAIAFGLRHYTGGWREK